MAVETELYVLYPEAFEDQEWPICPAIITRDLEVVKEGLKIVQEGSTKTQYIFKVIRVTEAEMVYKITPESLEPDEEVEEDLIPQIERFLASREDYPFNKKDSPF